ncbi:DUF2326 domain-containing protein [Sporomusa sphaeroides]|uniref:DUF2326 domain-containing protein n=1 Tax=Sporomusa sphaeroides DSM 2875 TaxID=1337886 RepID=A0ABP2CAI4_9FIRM|nr:DUF2326 domain-containing protein [Sporomusa sphaeroides]OLS57639.1 hypothetical protein SPSPH_11550 [Sporomusa sphaeroides DSM 2875]CVK21336.1 hypothetical protein SSPH_04023 [Sporomusa sphaeroides DSM 2875]
MLKQIICDKFVQKEIILDDGLNAVVGDDIASNSIGKSTLLMIIDFLFGGEDYIKKNHDAIDHLGHHEFKFLFEFADEKLYFIRTTNEYKFIAVCNDRYEIQKRIKVEEYTNLLQEKYKCRLEDLTFRNIVGRYFRIYGKENLNERKPIQYFEKEAAANSIIVLLKLFDKFKIIKEFEEQIEKLTDERAILIEAAKKDLIPRVTKTIFNKNEKRIVELNQQLEALKTEIISASADIEALISKEVLSLRKEKSTLITKVNVLKNRLIRTQTNLKNKNINIQPELKQLLNYFPSFNVEQVEKVDSFHESITKILKEELLWAEKEVKAEILEIEKQILILDDTINSKLTIQNAPKFAIDKIIELAAQINQLGDENGYFTKKENLDDSIKSATENLDILKEKVLDEMCSQINIKMHEINKQIYIDGRRAPTLNIHGNKYTFNTYGDTGTGTAFANLVTFDLALLDLTCLPAIAHDLPLLKNIENLALENIVDIYSKSRKQVFIAIDKLSSYSKDTAQLIESCKVLQLSKDKLLFTKNWKQDNQTNA